MHDAFSRREQVASGVLMQSAIASARKSMFEVKKLVIAVSVLLPWLWPNKGVRASSKSFEGQIMQAESTTSRPRMKETYYWLSSRYECYITFSSRKFTYANATSFCDRCRLESRLESSLPDNVPIKLGSPLRVGSKQLAKLRHVFVSTSTKAHYDVLVWRHRLC